MLRWLRGTIALTCVLWGIGALAQSSASPSSSCKFSPSATLCKEVTTTFTQPSVTFSPAMTIQRAMHVNVSAGIAFSPAGTAAHGGLAYPVTLTVACALNPLASICLETTSHFGQPEIAFDPEVTATKTAGSGVNDPVALAETCSLNPAVAVCREITQTFTQPSVAFSPALTVRRGPGRASVAALTFAANANAFVTPASGTNFNINPAISLNFNTSFCDERGVQGGNVSATISPAASVCLTRNFPSETLAFAAVPTVKKGRGVSITAAFSLSASVSHHSDFSVPVSFGITPATSVLITRTRDIAASVTFSPQVGVLLSSGASAPASVQIAAADAVFKNVSRPTFESSHIATSTSIKIDRHGNSLEAVNISASPSVVRSLHAYPTTSLGLGTAVFIASTGASGNQNANGNVGFVFGATATRSLQANRSLSQSVSIAAALGKSVGWQKPDTSAVGVSASASVKTGLGRIMPETCVVSAIATVAVNGVETQRRRGMFIGGM